MLPRVRLPEVVHDHSGGPASSTVDRPRIRRIAVSETTPGTPAEGAGNDMNTLVCDIGGTSVKILLSGQTKRRKAPSGPKMTAEGMVEIVKDLGGEDWSWDRIAIG